MTSPPSPPTASRGAARVALDAGVDALRFFTRLPLPDGLGSPAARVFDGIASAAPLAGVAVGAAAAAALGLGLALGLPPLAAAAFAVAVAAILSGALHHDALCDVADGFGGGRTREAKLAIMRDSHVGSYGVTALTLALIARVTLIAALGERLGPGSAAAALIAAAALARPLALLPALLLAPARPDGAGAAARPSPRAVAVGCALGSAATLVLSGFGPGGTAIVVAGLAALAVTALARRQIGGYTGDVCGAVAELAEIAALAALVAAAS
jgi:adenosylcobinamide-GDP ribazoletransferase